MAYKTLILFTNGTPIGAVRHRPGRGYWFNPLVSGRKPSRRYYENPHDAIPAWARKLADRVDEDTIDA